MNSSAHEEYEISAIQMLRLAQNSESLVIAHEHIILKLSKTH